MFISSFLLGQHLIHPVHVTSFALPVDLPIIMYYITILSSPAIPPSIVIATSPISSCHKHWDAGQVGRLLGICCLRKLSDCHWLCRPWKWTWWSHIHILPFVLLLLPWIASQTCIGYQLCSRLGWNGWYSVWMDCLTRWYAFHLWKWLPCYWRMPRKCNSSILLQRWKFLALTFCSCLRIHASFLGWQITDPLSELLNSHLLVPSKRTR